MSDRTFWHLSVPLAAMALVVAAAAPADARELKPTEGMISNEIANQDRFDSGAIPIQLPGRVYQAHVWLSYDSAPKMVSYRVSKSGDAIFEGDINLGNASAVQRWSLDWARTMKELGPNLAVARDDEQFKWPGGVVPYKITGKFSNVTIKAIEDGIDELNSKTNVQIIPYVKKAHPDYVEVVLMDDDEPGGGQATPGRQGKRQYLYLKKDADAAAATHEFMHVLGFRHEHTRANRNQFVEIKEKNIMEGLEGNFAIDAGSSHYGPYDKASIMHYDGFAFAKSCDVTRFGRKQKCGICADMQAFIDEKGECYPTIIDLATNKPFVRTRSLSADDIAAVNLLYPKAEAGKTLPSVSKPRSLRTTVERVITREGPGESGVCGTKTDYVYRLESGPVLTMPGVLENGMVLTQARHKEDDKPYRSNDFRPSGWQVVSPVDADTELMRIDLYLWDHDDAICGGKDDVVDINPTGAAFLRLLLDTSNGDLFYLNVESSSLPGQNSYPQGAKVGNIFNSTTAEYLTMKFNGLLDGKVDYKDEAEVHIKIEILES